MLAGQKIAVVGLGYVGLPLAVALARSFPVTGIDIDAARVAEIRAHTDRTLEVSSETLRASTLTVTTDVQEIADATIFIVTVPTPVSAHNEPDLTAVLGACTMVGRALRPGAIVVFESTVYPGVTEDLCGPALEAASGLACGRDFFLGYSPERINPGDREHTLERITKIVAGQTAEVAETLACVYGAINDGNIFIAANIKTAEAAKVIENAQRDINIAFMNEITLIFNRLGLSVYDVLDAAKTKWNFLPFAPGLVGGHCIGVDPFYLAHCARRLGHNPEIILAGRRINDGMSNAIGALIADTLQKTLRPSQIGRVLVLGLTFKENIPDLRNTKVADLVAELKGWGCHVDVHDPWADPAMAAELYHIQLLESLDNVEPYDCLVGAVAHHQFTGFDTARFRSLVRPGGLIADVKNIWRSTPLPDELRRWQL